MSPLRNSRPLILAGLLFVGAFHLIVVMQSGYWPTSANLAVAKGSPIGRDFLVFWTASSLALQGDVAAIFDPAALQRAMMNVMPMNADAAPWFYPPIFLLYVLPLALLPYLPSLFLWLAAPLAFLIGILRRLAPLPFSLWLILFFPGIGQSLAFGQNAILSTALLAAGFWMLDRRPLLAGVFFGLLSYKPQLCILLIPALFFGGYRHVILSMLATILGLVLLTIAVFGLEPWRLFLQGLHLAGTILETREKLWPLMATVYASARLAGMDGTGAQILQGACAVALLVAVCAVWRTRAPMSLKGSAVVTAIPLVTPYALNYDLALLILPIAWLCGEGIHRGWLRGEQTLLAVAWTLPMWGWLVAAYADLLLTPFVLLALFLAIVRRVRRFSTAGTDGTTPTPAGGLAPTGPTG